MVLVAVKHCAAEDKPAATKNVPRWSRIQIQSAILTTGSGAPVQLRDLDVALPPKEFRATMQSIIRSGTAFLTSEALTRLINNKVSSNSMKNLRIETEDGQKAKISGTMQKAGIPVPVNIEGPVWLTPDGLLRMEIKSEKAGVVPIKALAGMLGFDPGKSIKPKQSGTTGPPAVRLEKDAVIVDPNALLGTARGRVVQAETSSKGLLLTFGSPKKK